MYLECKMRSMTFGTFLVSFCSQVSSATCQKCWTFSLCQRSRFVCSILLFNFSTRKWYRAQFGIWHTSDADYFWDLNVSMQEMTRKIECKRIYFLNPFWYPDGLCFRNKPSAFLPPFLLSFIWIFFFFSKSVSFLFFSRSIVKTLPPKISSLTIGNKGFSDEDTAFHCPLDDLE